MPNGVANLTSQTGEMIRIDFSALYSPPTPGSSAWTVHARNIQITLTVPQDRPLPTWFLAQLFPGASGSDQAVILQNPGGRVYSGAAPYDIVIRSGSAGLSQGYDQMYEFTPRGGSSLIDPINGSSLFQTNLFFATPFATIDQGLWHTL